jgi:hypothetical protein
MKKTLLLNYFKAATSRNPRKNTTRFNGLLALFLVVMGMGVSWGQVTLPHHDPLNYTVGQGLQNQTNWTLINSGDDLLISSGNLSYSGLPTSTGNKVVFSGAGIDAAKLFTQQTSGTVYYSFILNVTSLGSLDTGGGYFTGFTEGTSNTNFGSTVWLRLDGEGFDIGINPRSTDGNTVWSTGTQTINTNILVVISYRIVSGTINDVVKLWINPTPGGSEPSATLSATNTSSDLANLNRIIIRQDSTTETPSIEMDELRIGTTWTSVTPPSSTTWNGSVWSNGTPTSSLDAVIAGDFSTTASGDTAGFTAKSLTVNSGKTFTINTGHTVTVAGAITNNGTFTVNNNANLVQTNVSATNSGNILVKRDSNALSRLDYTLWSSPVASQNLLSFSSATVSTRFYTYNTTAGTNGLYSPITPSTNNFTPGAGYLIRMPDNAPTAPSTQVFNGQFSGVPNNGEISFTMTDGGAGKRFNLVGNPYPSPISISSFVSDNNANITGTLYFWRKTNGTGTAYCTYAGTTYTSNGNAQAANPNGIIQTGQGFFVEASGSGTALLFKNSQRVSNTANQFFRSNIIENNRIWLNATNSSGAFSQMAVGYMTDATQNVDSLDGKYINDSPFALTSLINSEEYTIQGRALPFSTSDSVPLGFKTNVAGNYNIAIDHVDGLFSNGQAIYLKDNLLNIVTNLGVGSYSFASAAGTFNSRFEIVYQSILGVNNPEFTSNNVVAFNENGDININSGSTVMEQVRVYDLQGRLLVEKKQINASETRINTTAVNQVLLLEITATTGSKVIKKIIK